ncbi:zinc-binding protein [Paraburkholderia sp. UCT31]|uniref:DUF7146 domain-containing protein n=1 Tax=Paraburkholderia sp. UCT31 TaxID=2615209 RepID=UPI00165512A0|nr:toprim domain-containing protein [Paraburkholderia sp. UCT31]MBC8737270.1 zinc-binding protein [Paraburkholderia sp. UCT31]
MNQPLMTFEELKGKVAGQWPFIFQALAPQLKEAMEANGTHVACPVHGGKDGFRFFKDWQETGGGYCNSCLGKGSGFAMLAWVNNYSGADAVREVAQWYRGDSSAPAVTYRPPPPPAKKKDPAKARADLYRVWKDTRPLQGTAAELYLEKRGIWKQNIPKSLRFHRGLSYWDNEKKEDMGTFPCLVAPMMNKDGTLIAIHRTYLTPEGNKAPFDEVKKVMSPAGDMPGCAIKLFPAGEVLGVAEGIETALAAHAIARIPVWSCYNTTLLAAVDIPDSVRHVVIWADLDRPAAKTGIRGGEQAANKLAKRLETAGKTYEILYPHRQIPDGKKGVDWLDVLVDDGLEGFPHEWRNWREPVAA